ncbi:MAG: hypothetical protein ACTSYS_14065 [Promethearchaeota archaeon]
MDEDENKKSPCDDCYIPDDLCWYYHPFFARDKHGRMIACEKDLHKVLDKALKNGEKEIKLVFPYYSDERILDLDDIVNLEMIIEVLKEHDYPIPKKLFLKYCLLSDLAIFWNRTKENDHPLDQQITACWFQEAKHKPGANLCEDCDFPEEICGKFWDKVLGNYYSNEEIKNPSGLLSIFLNKYRYKSKIKDLTIKEYRKMINLYIKYLKTV